MTPFDLIIFIIVVGLASIYADRRWQTRHSRRERPSDATLAGEEGLAEGVSPSDNTKAKKGKRWWGRASRRERPSDATPTGEEGLAEGVSLPTDEIEAGESGETPAVGKQEGEEGEEETADPFGTWVAILIALVTLVGAWVGWGIGNVYGEASGEQSAGLSASLNVESTLTNSSVALYKEYRVFTEYARHQTLADLQADDIQGESASVLPARKTDDADLAAVQLPFFLTRYLTRNGEYDRPRQLGEAWAEAAQRVDLDPAPHFVIADAWQSKVELLVGLFIVLSFSLLFLTLAEALDRERQILRYSVAILGTLLLILTVIAKFWIERG